MSGVGALYSSPCLVLFSCRPAFSQCRARGLDSWLLSLHIRGQKERGLEAVVLARCPACPTLGRGRIPCLLCLGGAPLREWAFCGLSTNTSHPWQVWTNPGGITWAVDPSPWCLSTCPMPGPALVPGPQALALVGLWGKPCTFRTRNVHQWDPESKPERKGPNAQCQAADANLLPLP